MSHAPGTPDENRRIRTEFRDLFRQAGLDRTEDEEEVVEFFCANEGHLTVAEIAERLAAQGKPIRPATVARVLRLLCEYGIAEEKRFDDGLVRFEHRHLGPGQHHDHMICVKCGTIQEFYDANMEALQDEVQRRYGFRPLRHRMEMYGLCARCRGSGPRQMPLVLATPGERVRVMEIRGGEGMRRRLAAMEILPGAVLEVVNASGAVIINVEGSRVALGHGMAHRVLVALIAPDETPPT